jgi:hypothetical protein
VSSSSTKRYGVRLTLPGASNEPYTVPGLHVLARPDQVTPLENDEDVARAREIAKTADIEVVDLDKTKHPVSGDSDGKE